MTTKQFNDGVQADINARIARADAELEETCDGICPNCGATLAPGKNCGTCNRGASKPTASQTFNLNVAEVLLDRAATAQKAYWDALAALERALGFDINTDDLGELDAYSVRDIYNKFA